MPYHLVIGNKNYSSWSLRAWLFMKESGVTFDETRIPLYTPTWARQIARYTPAGRGPGLIDGNISVWDSSAIFQYIPERHPAAVGWPKDDEARARAQSISGEMHSGFLAIRNELPQNIRIRRQRDVSQLSAACLAQIRRVDEIWSDCRHRYGNAGDWLFGEFSLA